MVGGNGPSSAALGELANTLVHNCAGTSANATSNVSMRTMLINSIVHRFSCTDCDVLECSISIPSLFILITTLSISPITLSEYGINPCHTSTLKYTIPNH